MRDSLKVLFVWIVLGLLIAVPMLASDPATEEKDQESSQSETVEAPSQAEIRAQRKAERKVKDVEQVENYRRSIPPTRVPGDLESDVIKVRGARNWHLLTYPTGRLPSQAMEKARRHVAEKVQDAPIWQGEGIDLGISYPWQKAFVTPNTNTWTAVGPTPLDSVGTTNNAFVYGTVSGRVGAEALVVDPNNTSVAYAGFVAGGLWKTTNLGSANVTWTPLWDDKDFVTQGVSAITFDPNDSQTLYVGTGDWAARDQFSAGIMKSTDGGATWTQLGADVFTPFSQTVPAGGNRWDNQNIKSIAIDPKNTNNLLVGTRYDLYASNDAGVTWQICGFGNNYTDPDPATGPITTINRISDIYLDDRGSQTEVYAAVGYVSTENGNNGVYRFSWPSVGCPSWPSDFTTLFGGFPAGTGSGTNGHATGRIELAGAIGADNSLTLYAQVQDAQNFDTEGTYVLRPDGGSTTWSLLSGSTNFSSDCDFAGTGQDWYDLFIAVDPNDDKTLYIGHIDVYRATVNSSYTSISQTNLTDVYGSGGCPHYGKVHPDQHAFTWVGNTGDFLVGNDGGVYLNTTGDGNGWQQLNDSFNTNQFYAGQIGADFAGNGMNGVQWLFGGMQDNGSASWDSTTNDQTWTARSLGGDGFFTTFDPINGTETSGIWMTEYVYGDLAASTSGADGPFAGKSFFEGCGPSFSGSPDWSTPFVLDTLHCNDSACENYVLGGDYVYVSTRFRRGCPSWTRVSGSLVKSDSGSILTVGLAPSEPKAVAAGTSDGKVWWTESAFSGSGCTLAAANSASFSCSNNSGATWIDADASNSVLPNRAILQVAFDPNNHNLVYAAVGGFDENTPSTPGHLFALSRSGSSITVTDKTGNLPNVPASAVAVNPHNRKQVFVGTHFGFYYTDDIDAATPTWVRYQDGMPNTVIQYLTIDRGPSNDPLKGTTLAAFTYGRGVFVLKLPTTTGGNNPPTAAFTYSCTDLTCDFTDQSTDSDGTIQSWAWDFGDSNTSSAQNPTHTFGSAGTYTVSLTVTDDMTATDSTSQQVTVTTGGGGITLSANGYKVQGKQKADLTWSGASSTNVDVYRDGVVVFTTANDGFETDNIDNKGGGTYVYQVCEAGTSTCSNTATVVF